MCAFNFDGSLPIFFKIDNASLIYGTSLCTSVRNVFLAGIGNMYKKNLSILKECYILSMIKIGVMLNAKLSLEKEMMFPNAFICK